MNYRKQLIRFFTFIGGIYFFLRFVLPREFTILQQTYEFKKYDDALLTGFNAVGVTAIGIGLIILVKFHGGALIHLRKNWGYSAALLTGLALMLISSGANWKANLDNAAKARKFSMLRDFTDRIIQDDKQATPGVKPIEERAALLAGAVKSASEELSAQLQQMDTALPRGEETAGLVTSIAALRAMISETQTAAGIVEEQLPGRGSYTELTALRARLAEVSVRARDVFSLYQAQSTVRKFYELIHQGLFVALGSAMFALLAFFIASAAFRAFRVRSMEALLMMMAAVVIIFGQLPPSLFGGGESTLALLQTINEVRQWLLTQLNSAAFRSIEIGAAIAGLVMAVRMWLSIESESFSNDREGHGR